MCCNRSNSNVQGNSGRRRCCCNDGNNGNVQGATEIALRGPGCISGTGRCGRFTADFVQGNRGFNCNWVSPDSGNRNRCGCCFRCLEELLSDNSVCPR
nr:hypothetical protein [Sedimentibacter sp.]